MRYVKTNPQNLFFYKINAKFKKYIYFFYFYRYNVIIAIFTETRTNLPKIFTK